MNLELSQLPDDAGKLKAVIVDLQHKLDELKADFEKETSILIEQIRLLRAQLYGRKTEKIPLEHSDTTLPLFDMPEPEELPVEEVEVPAHKRKKRGRKPLPEDLHRETVIHDIPEEEKVCACGARLDRIGGCPVNMGRVMLGIGKKIVTFRGRSDKISSKIKQ